MIKERGKGVENPRLGFSIRRSRPFPHKRQTAGPSSEWSGSGTLYACFASSFIEGIFKFFIKSTKILKTIDFLKINIIIKLLS